MPYLMVGDNLAFFITHHAVFFLFSTDSHKFKCFKQIGLIDKLSSILYRIDGSLVNHIGKIRSHQTGSSQCQCIQIHRFIHVYILGMYF